MKDKEMANIYLMFSKEVDMIFKINKQKHFKVKLGKPSFLFYIHANKTI
jgi:hypothetical protein